MMNCMMNLYDCQWWLLCWMFVQVSVIKSFLKKSRVGDAYYSGSITTIVYVPTNFGLRLHFFMKIK